MNTYACPPSVAAGNFIPFANDAFIVVETTDDPAANGASLLAAYAAAVALTPNGASRSATNRSACLVPEGVYDIGSASLVTQDFCDLVGLTTSVEGQFITGDGTLYTVDSVGSTNGMTIRNVTIQCTGITRVSNDSTDIACFRPSGSTAELIENVILNDKGGISWSSQLGVIYAGTYINVLGGDGLFGGYGGQATGKFTLCIGGERSFGEGSGCVASGQFNGCIAGDFAFGEGGDNTLGRFVNCTSSGLNSFRYASGGMGGTAFACVKGGVWNVAATGRVLNCIDSTTRNIFIMGIPNADPAIPGVIYRDPITNAVTVSP